MYRNKLDDKGNMVHNKARIVAKGYSEKEGFDYEENICSCWKIRSNLIIISLCLTRAWASDYGNGVFWIMCMDECVFAG